MLQNYDDHDHHEDDGDHHHDYNHDNDDESEDVYQAFQHFGGQILVIFYDGVDIISKSKVCECSSFITSLQFSHLFYVGWKMTASCSFLSIQMKPVSFQEQDEN